jgi:hypothetical protein
MRFALRSTAIDPHRERFQNPFRMRARIADRPSGKAGAEKWFIGTNTTNFSQMLPGDSIADGGRLGL